MFQDPSRWDQRSSGGREENCERRAAGHHLGASAHGQTDSLHAVQHAGRRRPGQVGSAATPHRCTPHRCTPHRHTAPPRRTAARRTATLPSVLHQIRAEAKVLEENSQICG